MTTKEIQSKESFFHHNWRWFVLASLFLATFLNYFDRQTLGTAIEPMAEEFGLNNIQRGNLLSAFVFSYAICLFFIGFIADRVNVRWLFPVMLLGWSISTILVGFATSYSQVFWLRVLLGVWESVNFPICIMIIGRIFPPVERSLAIGIFASGAFLATLAAPPSVIYFSNNYDWRYSFIFAGLLGLAWLVPWLLIFRRPEERSAQWANHVGVDKKTGSEVKKVEATNYVRPSIGKSHREVLAFLIQVRVNLLHVIRQPGFWGIALMGLGIAPSIYFATQWFPSYFTQQLGQPYDQALAWKLSLIYLMQDVGLILGGWMVMLLSQKRFSILKARKAVITFAGAMMMGVLVVPSLSSVGLSVFFLCLYVCGIGAFLGNQHAFKQDIDIKLIATVSALVGGIETGFAAIVVKRVGLITNETADFGPVFYALAGLALFGVVVVHIFVKPRWFRVE